MSARTHELPVHDTRQAVFVTVLRTECVDYEAPHAEDMSDIQ